jgi:ribosomal protein S18 acetylase RimI-like enzyme
MTGPTENRHGSLRYVVRRPNEHDHRRILDVMDEWWAGLGGLSGSQERAQLLPRLFFQHFNKTSSIIDRSTGPIAAFLVAFQSQSQKHVAYIHFAGVDPELRRTHLGTGMYAQFFDEMIEHGVKSVKCVTSPENSSSISFHQALGFSIDSSSTVVDGLPVQTDYDGPGLHRVVFTRNL